MHVCVCVLLTFFPVCSFCSPAMSSPIPLYDPLGGSFGKTIFPATNRPPGELAMQSTRSCYEHFHRPRNDYNRFMAKVTERERPPTRTASRPYPYNIGETMRASFASRPSTAPGHISNSPMPAATHTATATEPAPYVYPNLPPPDVEMQSLSERTVTATGTPVYSVQAVLEADIQEGTLFNDQDEWRKTAVMTYEVCD